MEQKIQNTNEKINERDQRRQKLNALREKGINPYPNSYDVKNNASEIKENVEKYIENKTEVSLAGRIMLFRIMGKSTFFTVKDSSDTIQLYVARDMVGEEYYNDIVKKLIDTGDIVGAKGTVFKTQTGETTIHVSSLTLLAKAINPLPEKFHGLTDTETRYRQRYIDLIVNDDVRKSFILRSNIIRTVREIMFENNFMEVETPMMHPILGGAKARPFVTHHNTLDMDLYLRVAPELYLKRLVVGGFERVFELNRSFRNEGVSTKHNPEFTMLEAYMAYANCENVMELVENIFSKTCENVFGKTDIEYQDHTLSFKTPFKRMRMADAVRETTGIDFEKIKDSGDAISELKKIDIEVDVKTGVPDKWQLMNIAFEERVEENLIQPTFITDYPTVISPLSKTYADNHEIAERYELFIAKMEMSNGFSELNDPIDQRERFEAQVEAGKKGDHEAMQMDDDYINALEYALPPTGGLGIGIDRMVMLMLNTASIRDTLLFPHMRHNL